MARLLLAAFVALLAPAALAQTCTTSWTNPAGGAWETPGNWSDGVPGPGSTACIALAGTYTVAQSSADRAVAGLVVGGASGTQTLQTFNTFSISGNSLVRPSGRWEVLNRTPGGSDGVYTTGTITVEGVFVQNGGTTLLDGAGTFDVAPGGRWELRDQVSAGIQARPGTYRLRGTLDAAYTSTQTINLPLDVQGGTIRVSQGRLDINGGTLANATVDAAAGATLLLNSSAAAPFTVTGTLSGAPAGEVYVNGGTFAATSGEVVLNVTGTGLLLGGSVNLTSGGGTFLNTGLLTHAETGSNFATLNGTTLRNTGRFVMPGRGFGFQNGGLFRNEASGVAEIANGGGFGGVGGSAGRVENAGLIVHTANSGGGTGTTGSIGVPYTGEAGSVLRTEAGRLDLTRGGSFRDASFDVPAGTTLLIDGSAGYTVTGTLSGTPAGDLVASGPPMAAGPGGATLSVGGTGFQLNSTLLTSVGGTFTNTGLLRKSDSGGNNAGLRGSVVVNRGMVDITSFRLLDGAVLRNEAGATVLLRSGGNLSGDGRLENAGLILRQGNSPGVGGTYSFGGLLRSLPGSELRSNEDRVDLQAPASRSIPDGATLTGTGKFLLPLEIEGAVSPGTAEQPLSELAFFSAFRLSLVAGSPRVVIDVAAGGASDTLTVGFGSGGGNTRLGGALVVRVQPGFTPAAGDAWTILRSESPDGITGQFNQVVAEGAPSGIAFVAERSADGASLVLRAVAVAPGGPITVSTTRVVGGDVRPLFLTGPGAASITAARLECTSCLDASAFATIPAQVVGVGALREARFDLTSPRAFGFYDLVLEQPGLPDERVPVTVRPFLGYVVTAGGLQRGGRVRPPGNGYNWSHYAMTVRTNTDAPAFSLPRVIRRDSTLFALALATGTPFSSGVVLYESDAAADPARAPLMIGRLDAGGAATMLSYGLRINPENVRFPEQAAVPNDPRVPFGEPRQFAAVGAQHLSQARASAAVGEGLRTSASTALTAYIASVDAAEPAAVASAFNTSRVSGQTYFTVPRDILGELLAVLDRTVPAPAGLAEAAGDAFAVALERAAFTRYAEIERAHVAALTGAPADVSELFDAESRALFPDGFPGEDNVVGSARRDLVQGLLCFLGFGPAIQAVNNQVDDPFGDGGGGGGGCGGAEGPADPNDKLAESTLICEFGTVTVDGEPQTRCVRYFVPRAQATEPVFYTVKFENIAAATAPAEFVTITDDLDTAFDISSLRIESTSSDSTFSYSISGRTVTFRFVGIDLPPNRTAPEGEGFVRYSVRPTAGLPDGTEIRNTANIVFDFNPAIATPTVLHEIRTVADLGTSIVAPDFVVVGTAASASVIVANLRGDAATAATVTISTGGAAAQLTPSSGSCTGAGPFVCSFGDLTAGETATVDVAFASAPAGTALTVSATAATTAFDGFAANNTDLASVGVATVGTEADPDVPRELTLSSPRPNPVRGATTLRWGLPAASSVDIRVYDLLGREVARIADGEAQEAGWHAMRWDAQVASGVYVVRVRVGDEVRTRRMTVIR